MPRRNVERERPVRLALLTSDYNHDITSRMADSARKEARRLGATVVRDVQVPGVFDMSVVAAALLARKDVDALVVLGAVIRGETDHDQLIAHATAAKLLDLAVGEGKPVGLAITGPGQTRVQAVERIDRAVSAVQAAVKVAVEIRRI